MGYYPILERLYLLPPASEGWGKVLFSVCLSVHTSRGGTLVRSGWRGAGVPWPGLDDGGGYASQVWMVGGGTPSQVLMVGGGCTPARS